MTTRWFRVKFEEFWQEVNEEADREKCAHLVVHRTNQLYRRAPDQEKSLLKEILFEWVKCGDPKQLFTALAIIDRNEIEAALPALRAYAEQLETRTDHEAPYARSKVQRIMERILTANKPGAA